MGDDADIKIMLHIYINTDNIHNALRKQRWGAWVAQLLRLSILAQVMIS